MRLTEKYVSCVQRVNPLSMPLVDEEASDARDMPFGHQEMEVPDLILSDEEDAADEAAKDPKHFIPEEEFQEVKDGPKSSKGGTAFCYRNSEVFITWPQSGELSVEAVRDHLIAMGFVKGICALEQHHSTLGNHIHAWAWRPKIPRKMKILGADKWTVGGVVAHISKLRGRNGTGRTLRMQQYVMKDQEYICWPSKGEILSQHFNFSKDFRKTQGDWEAWERYRMNMNLANKDPFPFALPILPLGSKLYDRVGHNCKRRNLYIHGEANIGKTRYMNQVFAGKNVFVVGEGAERFENYNQQQIIIFPMHLPSWKDIEFLTDPQQMTRLMPGKQRYNGIFAKDVVRTVIIFSNFPPRYHLKENGEPSGLKGPFDERFHVYHLKTPLYDNTGLVELDLGALPKGSYEQPKDVEEKKEESVPLPPISGVFVNAHIAGNMNAATRTRELLEKQLKDAQELAAKQALMIDDIRKETEATLAEMKELVKHPLHRAATTTVRNPFAYPIDRNQRPLPLPPPTSPSMEDEKHGGPPTTTTPQPRKAIGAKPKQYMQQRKAAQAVERAMEVVRAPFQTPTPATPTACKARRTLNIAARVKERMKRMADEEYVPPTPPAPPGSPHASPPLGPSQVGKDSIMFDGTQLVTIDDDDEIENAPSQLF